MATGITTPYGDSLELGLGLDRAAAAASDIISLIPVEWLN